MPGTVTYRSLQDVVVRAGGRFPDTQFFLSKDPAMPYVLSRDLYRLCGRFGSKVRRGGVSRALKIERILHFIQTGEGRTPCIGFGG